MQEEIETKSSMNGTTSAEKDDGNNLKSTSLIEREDIEGTPFQMVKQDGNYFLTFGHYRLTTPTASKEFQRQLLEKKDWDLIATFIYAITHIREGQRQAQ